MIYRAVLDPSAVAAYAAGSEHVGELLSEFSDEHIRFAVPAACLVEARAADADLDRLHALASHQWAALLDMEAAAWPRLGAGARLLDGVGRACAALLVADGVAGYVVVTSDPDVYGSGFKTIELFD